VGCPLLFLGFTAAFQDFSTQSIAAVTEKSSRCPKNKKQFSHWASTLIFELSKVSKARSNVIGTFFQIGEWL